MKKNLKLIICIVMCICVLMLVTVFLNKNSENEIKPIKELEKYEDVVIVMDNSSHGDKIEFNVPKDDTIQDYNTYYGNMIQLRLESQSKFFFSILNELEMIVSSVDFRTLSGYDVFEGIEKYYYYDKLCFEIDNSFKFSNVTETIKQLVDETYYGEGYFLSPEFKTYMSGMSDEEIVTTKLSQTMQMLFLCKRYELLDEIYIEDVGTWIKEQYDKNMKNTDKFYVYLSMKYIGKDVEEVDKEFFYNIKNTREEFDLIETYAFVYLMNEGKIEISSNEKKDIVSLSIRYIDESKMSNLMELYYAVAIVDLIDDSALSAYKTKICSLLNIYRYDNGLYPVISSYICDNKQLMIYYENAKLLGLDVELGELADNLTFDLNEQDVADIYALVRFEQKFDMDVSGIGQKIIDMAKECSIDNINQIAYLNLILGELVISMKEEYLDSTIIDYLNILTTAKDIEYNIVDLILINSFLQTGYINETDVLVDNIKNTDVTKFESLVPIGIYHKYNIMKNLDMDIEQQNLKNIIMKYRCEGGFKMEITHNFFDIQATNYLLKIVSDIENLED